VVIPARSMQSEEQEKLSARHIVEHFKNSIPLSIDHSCTICYPQPKTVSVGFKNFWDWIEAYFLADTYTLYTVQALHTYFIAFQNNPNTKKSQQVIDLATKILLSIAYSIRPNSFTDLIYFFLNFTYHTNYFKNPVTADLINTYNSDITAANTLSATQVPLLPIPVPTPPNPNTNMAISQNEMLLLFQEAFGAGQNGQIRNIGDLLNDTLINNNNTMQTELQNNLATINALAQANQNHISTKIIDVPTFHGQDNEDPYEWLQLFESAFAANGWPDNRKLALASGFLRDAARDWWVTNQGQAQNNTHINVYYDNNAQARSFDIQLKAYFVTQIKRDRWLKELQSIKQGETELVEDYSRRFRKLMRKATQGQALAAHYQVNFFIHGLKSILVGQVVLANPANLNAAIERAKLVETGVNFTMQSAISSTTPTIATLTLAATNSLPAAVATTPATTITLVTKPSPEDEIEALTKQMQQLAFNYANLSSVLLAQGQGRPPRNSGSGPRFNGPKNNNNSNNNNRNPNITCYHCGNQGHISYNCQLNNRSNGQNNNNNNGNNGNNHPCQRTGAVNYLNFEEDYEYDYEDEEEWYEEDDEEFEIYTVTTRSRSAPYDKNNKNKRPKFLNLEKKRN
jgi:hypothetical protein